ncbi:class I SAM-dependent methyltransferase [Oxalobacteraceae bacterium R-40]|uniref:Class I SAM-dependent methyltransferase n=1 Tax=Keguizhuia sedimenti TaxID=3064264 RepID=A0ABU1BTZ9_9BURK|nr:class I SAM-dependent methyltransferase [Oxalobacteraceae bacterium R-40]
MDSHSVLEQASPWVKRFAPLIPSGEVLDLACGGGRHSRFLAARGLSVLAVDREASALSLAAGKGIATLQCDLESDDADKSAAWPFRNGRFQGIVVTNYLHRPLFGPILNSLVPGGILIYETFAAGNERFGKPSNPNFLLQPGELLKIAQDAATARFHIIAFEDGYASLPKPAMVQRICLCKLDGERMPETAFNLGN